MMSCASIIYLWLLLIQETSSDLGKRQVKDIQSCTKPTLDYPISTVDLQALQKNDLIITTQPCSSTPSQTCLSVDRKSLIGAGTYGLVVRARSRAVHFPVAMKFLKLPSKLDVVSFNLAGRYNRIELQSLAKNQGTERSLREAVSLRLLTEYEIPAVPKYVAYFETASYRILAMEFLEGYEELSEIIDRLSPKEFLSISCQTAAIVCNLDQLGVAHDDLHERNILVDRGNKNKVCLIDFGGAHFNGKEGHFTSASNFLKQPINLLGHLKRLVKEDLLDQIQSQEKQELGRFCSMMGKLTSSANENDRANIPSQYRILLEKYWKISQTKKKLFKCTLEK